MPAEVRDGEDVLALGDHRREERRAQLFPHPGDVDGPDARDLADLAGYGLATPERFVPDDDVHGHVCPGLRRGWRRGGVLEDEPGDRVRGIRVVGFVIGPGLVIPEDPLRLLLDHSIHLRTDFGRIPERSGPHAIAVGPPAKRAVAMLTFTPLLRIFDGQRAPRRTRRATAPTPARRPSAGRFPHPD